jgi:hypothetical protein
VLLTVLIYLPYIDFIHFTECESILAGRKVTG